MRVPADVKLSWFVFVLRLDGNYDKARRDAILAGLRAKGIGCNDYFTPIHLQPFYVERFGYKPGDFPITESLSQRTIALPFHNHLTERDADYVVKALRELL